MKRPTVVRSHNRIRRGKTSRVRSHVRVTEYNVGEKYFLAGKFLGITPLLFSRTFRGVGADKKAEAYRDKLEYKLEKTGRAKSHHAVIEKRTWSYKSRKVK